MDTEAHTTRDVLVHIHAEDDVHTEEEKMQHTEDKLVKKRITRDPGTNPEQHSSPNDNTTNVQEELEGVFSDSDAEATMEAGESAPLQEGSSDPHGPKASRITPGKYPETEEGIEDFRYAIYKETNEAAGNNLWKISLWNRIRMSGSTLWAIWPSLFFLFRTTPDRLTGDNYSECKAKNHRTLRKLHPDKRRWTFPGISPGKEAILDEVVRLILQALELFEIRVKDGRRGGSQSTAGKRWVYLL